MSKGYRELYVWNKAYNQVLNIYKITKTYPKDERYGLISQMRKSAISITANIAEGHGKRYLGEYIRFVSTAIGSCNELGVYLNLSRDFHYLNNNEFYKLNANHEEISKMLFGLRRSLENKLMNRQNKTSN
jgi:four helix bundle protein